MSPGIVDSLPAHDFLTMAPGIVDSLCSPPESPATAAKRPKVEVHPVDEEEGPDAYIIFKDKYDAGDLVDARRRPRRDNDDDKRSDYIPGYGFKTDHLYDNTEHMNQGFAYMSQLVKYEGFDVDFYPDWPIPGGVVPIDLEPDNEYYPIVHDCVSYAIQMNNADEAYLYILPSRNSSW